MNKQTNWIASSVVVALVLGSIGCGQGFKTQNGNSASTTGISPQASRDVSSQIAMAAQATKDAQSAMADAQAAIASITDANGNINMNLFNKTLSLPLPGTGGLLSPVIAKLQPIFDNVFSKATLVKQQFDAARASLATAIAGLNSADPAQAAQIAQITAQLAQIDKMEQQFTDAMHLLAGKIDLAVAALNNVVSGITSYIPGFGWLAGMAIDYLVMDDVKNLLADFKAKLISI